MKRASSGNIDDEHKKEELIEDRIMSMIEVFFR